MISGRSIRSARRNARAAFRRADADEFARLTLDLAGLLDRVRDVEVVRAELLGIAVPAVDYSVPEDPRRLDDERDEEVRRLIRAFWEARTQPKQERRAP
ncbi:MAG: hypothetical protein IT372_28915 [Polyangiaceae bacterium]|nr:hypothetical protein [Polyangiaceae bacterium]